MQRELWVNEIRRAPFFEPKRAGIDVIEIKQKFLPEAMPIPVADTANGLLLEFFDQFGWNPRPDQIRVDQDRLYNREF